MVWQRRSTVTMNQVFMVPYIVLNHERVTYDSFILVMVTLTPSVRGYTALMRSRELRSWSRSPLSCNSLITSTCKLYMYGLSSSKNNKMQIMAVGFDIFEKRSNCSLEHKLASCYHFRLLRHLLHTLTIRLTLVLVNEMWTHPHRICCTASWYCSFRAGLENISWYFRKYRKYQIFSIFSIFSKFFQFFQNVYIRHLHIHW